MPIAQNPEEYYQHYCLSQQRVERWVQETDRQRQQAPQLAQGLSHSYGIASKESYQHEYEQERPPAKAVGDGLQRTSHRSSSSKPHRMPDVSRSRSRPSTGSKKIGSDGTKRRSQTPVSFATYLPYGILPLLFAVTGTSVVSVLFPFVLLAGYIVSAMDESEPSSPRKHRKHP